jgi:hypothetical protein
MSPVNGIMSPVKRSHSRTVVLAPFTAASSKR